MWQLGGGRNVVGGTGEFGVAPPESVSGRMTPTRDLAVAAPCLPGPAGILTGAAVDW
jgi:hypothetical protein